MAVRRGAAPGGAVGDEEQDHADQRAGIQQGTAQQQRQRDRHRQRDEQVEREGVEQERPPPAVAEERMDGDPSEQESGVGKGEQPD
jgi:hypothetical protein